MSAHRPYTDADVQLLRELFATTTNPELARMLGRSASSISHKASQLQLAKAPGHHAATSRRTMSMPEVQAKVGIFKPGEPSVRKGRKCPGWRSPTTFGGDNKPPAYAPPGSTRITSRGYLELKVTDGDARWKPYHVHVWEQAHGPVPEGFVVAFKPGRRSTSAIAIVPDALELVTRQQLMSRHSFTNYPPELRDAMTLVAKIRSVIDDRSQDDR